MGVYWEAREGDKAEEIKTMTKSQAQIEAVKQICNSLAMENGNGFKVSRGQKQLFVAFEILETEGICNIARCEHSDSGLYVVTPIIGKYI